jgi:phosphatidylglycerophosphatase A
MFRKPPTRIARALATAGGAGYIPWAPGTWGTVVAVPIAYVTSGWPLWSFALLCVGVTVVGIWAASVADEFWGTHDSGRIVIDEVAGYLVTMMLVDRSDVWLLVIGFVLFRLLDITKPPPIRTVERRLPGGAGVVLDDVAAGVMAALLLVGLDLLGVPAQLHALLGS